MIQRLKECPPHAHVFFKTVHRLHQVHDVVVEGSDELFVDVVLK